MATGIPLPGNMIDTLMNGIKTGSGLYTGAMHPILEREKQKQLEAHFQEQLKLSKAAAARNAQTAADAHKLALMKMDPDREINQLKHLMAAFGGGGTSPQQATTSDQMPSFIPSIQNHFDNNANNLIPQESPLESEIPSISGNPSISYSPESFMPGVHDRIADSSQKNPNPLESFIQSAMGNTREGLIRPGNIDLGNRPLVKNPKGGTSTIYSMGVGLDNGQEALIPRVSDDGRILSEKEAFDQFKKTGKHLGIFNSREAADKAAKKLHTEQESQYGLNVPQMNPNVVSEYDAAQSQKGSGGIDMDAIKASPILRGWFKKKFGVDPGAPNAQTSEEKLQDKIKLHQENKLFDMEHPSSIKENPEQKRAAELRDKIELEKYKTEQKKALEETKNQLARKETHQKVIDSAKNDLPHLESTLEALENMKTIATNNPDMFGHSGLFGLGAEGAADRFSKTSANPNVGAWQTYGLGPIVSAESKMSSKGNQLALKQALANKPNFSEDQQVALSKIKSSIQQVKKSIEDNKKLSGATNSGDEGVKVLNGHRYKQINGEWHEIR